jgi:isoquinoline 1-oxidoreductase beta subunit
MLGVRAQATAPRNPVAAPEITAWIVIKPDDTVVIRVARSEMGQGILTALPMLVAEELECDWAKVHPEFASPAENLRRDRVWGNMSTGASRSVSASQEVLRRAGATAREMLIAAAAKRWSVPPAECRARDSVITHLPSGRTVTFGKVAVAAAKLKPPAQVRLKDPGEWRLIGTPQRRFDVRAKITGEPIYAIDVRLPGMLHAAIRHCPVFGGTLQAVDEAAVLAMRGVRRVVKLPEAVAVVADSWWQASKALDALPVTWNFGEHTDLSSETIARTLQEGLAADDAGVGVHRGNVDAAMAHAATHIEADYAVPFLAHSTLEPQNCTAHVTPDRVEIWAPTQDGETALAAAAVAANVPPSKVIVHKMMLGGGFGRRGAIHDFVEQAVLIAKEVGRPVQLVWSREQDIQHDQFRPVAMARMTAGFDREGMPVAWRVRVSAQSILDSIAPDIMRHVLDHFALEGLLDDNPYPVPHYLADYAMRNTPVPVGVWRAVNHSQNCFFRESFIDEMAHASGHDPYQFRRRLLASKPKFLAVLDAAARKAAWGDTDDELYRGIAINENCATITAQVVEISVSDEGLLKVHRVVSAMDTGHVVNPLTIEMQTESAVVYALSAALAGEITIKNGRVEQSNFGDYPTLPFADMPKVETVLVPSGGFWGGVGEPPLTPLAPALCNAIFAATGRRIRSLPIKNHSLRRQTSKAALNRR